MRSGRNPRIAFEILIAYAAGWFLYVNFQRMLPDLAGIDGYYHAKLAWIYAHFGVIDEFPWATHSLWSEHYFDKDFLFHILIAPFTLGDLMTGAKFAQVSLVASVFASFFGVLRLRGVPMAWLWTLLLMLPGGLLGERFLMLRPHLLAVALSLWLAYFLCRRSWLGTAVIAVLLGLAYTAPHLVLAFALVHAAACALVGERGYAKLLAAAVVGSVVGAILHPHFPNNLLWWQQGLKVIGTGWGMQSEVHGAGELLALDTRFFLIFHLPLLLCAVAAVVALRRFRAPFDAAIWTLVALAGGSFVASCMSARFVEYFVPYSLWLCAEIFARWAAAPADERGFFGRLGLAAQRRLTTIACGLLIALSAYTTVSAVARQGSAGARGRLVAEGARWLQEHSRKDEQVFTCDYSTAPELFFHNHHNRYMVFLDASYMFDWRPSLFRQWKKISKGELDDPVLAMRELFGARLGYCETRRRTSLLRTLEADPRVRLGLVNSIFFTFEILDVPPPPAYRFEVGSLDEIDPSKSREAQLLAGAPRFSGPTLNVRQASFVDLTKLVGSRPGMCANLRAYIEPANGPRRFLLGTSGDVAVWIGGELRHVFTGSRRPSLATDSIVTTAAGDSSLRIRLCWHGEPRFGFYLSDHELPSEAAR